MAKPTLVVLAAGMGSRYGGLKQIDPVGPSEETILDYSVYDAIRAGFDKVVFVIRRDFEEAIVGALTSRFGNRIRLEFVSQELDMVPDGVSYPDERKKPWGTAHAVIVATSAITDPFAVINADDFYGADAYRVMFDFLSMAGQRDSGSYCMVGYELGKTLSEFGHVSRGVCQISPNGLLAGIIERTHIEQSDDGIYYVDDDGIKALLSGNETVSMNMWGFTPSALAKFQQLFEGFLAENADDPKSEFYIPTAVNDLMTAGEITVRVLKSTGDWFGVTYKEDKSTAQARILGLVQAGIYPERLWG